MTAMMRRALLGREQLQRLFEPKSIAVLGISSRSGSFGERTWKNLQSFEGHLYAVNPKYDEYAGVRCYADLRSLPEIPDCVLLATARELTEDLVRTCAALGVGGVVIYASGYAETGKPERAEEQERLGRIASDSGLRILGPNCMGFVHCGLRIGLSFATLPRWREPSNTGIGLVSQSGAVGIALLQALERGVSFSHMLTTGNSVDLDVSDQIAYLAQCPDCAAIACVFEGVKDPEHLIEAGRRARQAGKPVVIFKIARTQAGAQAALSHTAMLAGADAAYLAAFDKAGMVLVDDLERLLETTIFLAKAARFPEPPQSVAVLSASGGMAIMALDKAQAHGIALPQPSSKTTAMLQAHVPDFGSARNPCDMTAQVANDIEALRICADALLSDPLYGLLLYPHTAATEVGTRRLALLERAAREQGKLVCVIWLPGWLEGPGAAEAEALAHCAVFRSMDSCMAAIAARVRWTAAAAAPDISPPSTGKDSGEARRLLASISAAVLTEREGLRLLSCYGIEVARGQLCTNAAEAASAAAALGFPVVLKIVSRDIPHKSDVGGVALDIRDAAGAHEAYERILASAHTSAPKAAIDGVAVQRMAAPGLELFMGSRRDPLFGVLVLVGLGGVLVELLQDTAVRIAPVSQSEALVMLRGLRGARLFAGFRGSLPVDLDAVADCIARFSRLAADFSEEIVEMDVNPIICRGAEVLAVDALVSRA